MLFCLACNTAPENWHICVNKGLTYLLYYVCLIYSFEQYSFEQFVLKNARVASQTPMVVSPQ